MFGIIGTIIYGIAYTIGWSRDEQLEQRTRKSFREAGLPYYYDKRGRQRWTDTGKKRSPQEILKDYEKQQGKQDSYCEKKALERYKEQYNLYVIHKDNLSFEEFVCIHMPPCLLKYATFRKIKDSVSDERIKEINSNRIKYG